MEERQNDHPVDQAEEEADISLQVDQDEDEDDVDDRGWPKELPPDLPRSLDDRRRDPTYDIGGETEYYDAWQGEHLSRENFRSH